jgi:hypothetical protein
VIRHYFAALQNSCLTGETDSQPSEPTFLHIKEFYCGLSVAGVAQMRRTYDVLKPDFGVQYRSWVKFLMPKFMHQMLTCTSPNWPRLCRKLIHIEALPTVVW